MNPKLLVFVIGRNDDKKFQKIFHKYGIIFRVGAYCKGTASKKIKVSFGLDEVEKEIIYCLIPGYLEANIFYDLKRLLKIEKPGRGIAFTVNLNASEAFLKEALEDIKPSREEIEMEKDKNYSLIVSIVNEGHADQVMSVARKEGASGGTLINGLGLETKEIRNLLGISISPEKDIVLIIALDEDKKQIMEAITDKVGITKDGNGIIFSLPVESVIGIGNHINFDKN